MSQRPGPCLPSPFEVLSTRPPVQHWKEERPLTSEPHQAEALQRILEEEAKLLAFDSGFIERERAFNGADFAQALILGWLQRPDERLEGSRRSCSVARSASQPLDCLNGLPRRPRALRRGVVPGQLDHRGDQCATCSAEAPRSLGEARDCDGKRMQNPLSVAIDTM